MIKRISELTDKELKKVFEVNSKLQYKVTEYLIESEMYYVSDNLDKFRKYLSDWNIGFYNYNNYIRVKDGLENEFIEGVFEAREDYGFLSDEEFEKWQDMFYVEGSDYNRKLFNEFVEIVLNKLNEMTDINNYDIEEYFIENYCENYLDDNDDYYVDYNTFELFEVVTKSYR